MTEDTPSKDDKKSLLEEAKSRFKEAAEWWSDNFDLARDDMRFRALDQWPDKAKRDRESDDRPVLVCDKTNQYVRQVVNDGRQNRPAVKVRPVDSGADVKVAEIYDGIIRHICTKSNADEAFDTALDSAVGSGFGFFRVRVARAVELSFQKELRVERIANPLAVYLDPHCRMADGSDANYGFIVDDIPKDRFASLYPNAKAIDWDADSEKYADGWMTDKTVRVCEYWYIEEESFKQHLLKTGEVMRADAYEAMEGEKPAIHTTEDFKVRRLKFARMTGAEILEENDGNGQGLGLYIPILPVYGNESNIDGKVIYSGLIRPAKDPQRLYNYSRSMYAERVALAPKAPFIAAAGQIEAYEDDWERANTANLGVLKYDPVDVDGTPVPAPQRIAAPDVPAAFAQDMQISEHDIQASMGIYNASIGEKSNEKSGRAIMARQREGDVATFHYQDNLNRAIRHLGRILVDQIPRYIDTAQAVRILGEDGKAGEARIDPEQQDAVVQKQGVAAIYNLGVGTYDVSVAAGPSYTTKREEMVDMLMQLTQANPALLQIGGDIMVRNMDMPGGEELADRMKKMLPPQLQDAPEEEGMSDDAKQIKAQASQVIDQQGQQIQAAEQGIQQRDQAMQDQAKRIAELELQLLQAKADKAKEVIAEAQRVEQELMGVMQQRDAIQQDNEAQAQKPAMADALLSGLSQLIQTMAQTNAEMINAMRETQAAIAQASAESAASLQNGHAALAGAVEHLTRPRTATISDGKSVRQITVQ